MTKKLLFKKIINRLMASITFIIPKSNKIVVIGGWFGKRFADNSKSMYLFLRENAKELDLKKIIFITKDENLYIDLKKSGFCVAKANSISSIWSHLRAKIHLVDMGGVDLNKILSINAKKVNMWHGYAMKKVGYLVSNPKAKVKELIELNEKEETLGRWNQSYYLSQSKSQDKQLSLMFGVKPKRIIRGLYPRVLYLTNGVKKYYTTNEKRYLEFLSQKSKGKDFVIGYFPTFRDNVEQNNICIQNLLELGDFLEKNNLIILTKFHFAAKKEQDHKRFSNRIINLPSDADVYNFLEFTDVLITDYSSIYFDYLLLNKPIIFFPFDYEYYNLLDRGFMVDYKSNVPGDIVYEIEQMKKSILECLQNPTKYKDKYKILYEKVKYMVYEDQKINKKKMFDTWKNIMKG